MIKAKDFEAALKTVMDYTNQINELKSIVSPTEIGCKVKLSQYGREMQTPHNKVGIVIDWLQWYSLTDGLVTVKWEGIKKPGVMHVSHVEGIKK